MARQEEKSTSLAVSKTYRGNPSQKSNIPPCLKMSSSRREGSHFWVAIHTGNPLDKRRPQKRKV